jgi:signal transduction histidine kinase
VRFGPWLWRALGGAVIACGLIAEHAGAGAAPVWLWLPDLAVGIALAAAGILSPARARGSGALLIVAAGAWFAGTAVPEASYWHRGVLTHLLVTYPGARPASRPAWLLVLTGYVIAIVGVGRDDRAGVVLGSLLLALSLHGARRARRQARRIACWTGAGLSGVVAVGAAARLSLPPGTVAVASLLGYEIALVVAALALWHGGRRSDPGAVTDVVVELKTGPSAPLADALADRLGDPTARLGYWRPRAHAYLDDAGEEVRPTPGRTLTRVDRRGEPFAVLLHDAAVEQNAAVAEAIAAADRLMSAHSALQTGIRDRVAQVAASRRRLQLAVDLERRHLEEKLAGTAGSGLEAMRTGLRRLGPAGGEHVGRAMVLLERTVVELRETARGLYPRELADGLAPAVRALAGRCPVATEVSVGPDRFSPEIESAVYYLCAEALANVVKHATASAVHVTVSARSEALVVVVADNGIGGADPSRGTGLLGLTDRVDSAGGTLQVVSMPGSTTLTAAFPLDGQGR